MNSVKSDSDVPLSSLGEPRLEKRRLEARRRTVVVDAVEALTPGMLRITFGGEDLSGFHSPSPDDHIKLFFNNGNDVQMRDYTPRRFDADRNALLVDFVLHEPGVASAWAKAARVGDQLQIGGPRGTTIISADGCWWLLIGDETALPSIGRRIEELKKGVRVISLVCVEGPQEELLFPSAPEHVHIWVHRPKAEASDPGPLLLALADIQLPTGPGFVWIAAESRVASSVRKFVVDVLGHPSEWTKASAYWEGAGGS